jgi:hypothetical protein
MTVIRLACGDLLVHSPTCLTPELKATVEKLGIPRWIVGPNRIHYWWIPEWKSAYPSTSIYLAPRIKEQAANRINLIFPGWITVAAIPGIVKLRRCLLEENS